MKKITGVYHLACISSRYMDIFCEQFDLLNSSGLYEACQKMLIYISKDNNNSILNDKLNEYDPKNKFIISRSKENLREKFALNNFRSHITDEEHIFYFHSKGVSRPIAKDGWRKILNHYTINKWYLNLELLERHKAQACGCFLTRLPELHFSGNFWWAKTDYIKNLPNCGLLRLDPEMWLGKNFNNDFVSLTNHDQYGDNAHSERSDEDILKNISYDIIDNKKFKIHPYWKRHYGQKRNNPNTNK